MFDRYALKKYNFRIIIYVLILNIIGILAISSASNKDMALVGKQMLGIAVGLTFLLILSLVPYDYILKFSIAIFIFCIIALLAVLLFGESKYNAKRWLILPVIGKLQPSEFVKFGIVIFNAWTFSKYRDYINDPRFLAVFMFIISIPYYLMLKQPDLSTTIVSVVSTLACLFVAEISYKWIFATLAVFVPSITTFIYFLKTAYDNGRVFFLKNYQAKRILAWIDRENYAEANFQQDNSIMAIGSGQLWGKGLNTNTLSSVKRGNFLVEEQTDFIFAVIGEELGFVGCLLVIVFLSLLVYELLNMAKNAKDMQGRIICTGLAGVIGFQAFTNISVATGIFPNTGIPLPFISYGVSSLLSLYICLGMALNVGLQRYDVNV